MVELYNKFEELDTSSNNENTIISLFKNKVLICAKQQNIIDRLDKSGFKKYRRENKLGDYVVYSIQPMDEVISLVKNFLVERKELEDKSMEMGLEALADVIDCYYYYDGRNITFTYIKEGSIPEYITNLFKKEGYIFGKHNKVVIKCTKSNLDKLKRIINSLYLTEDVLY